MRLRLPWNRRRLYQAMVCGAAMAAWNQEHHKGMTMVTFLNDADLPEPIWSELTDDAPAFLDWSRLLVPPDAHYAMVSGHIGSCAAAALIDRKGRLSMAAMDAIEMRFAVCVEPSQIDITVLGSFLHAFDGVA